MPDGLLGFGVISLAGVCAAVEAGADGHRTFHFCAPDATDVRVTSSDMPEVITFGPGGPVALPLTKDATGLWSGTTGKALAPDNYRYDFVVMA